MSLPIYIDHCKHKSYSNYMEIFTIFPSWLLATIFLFCIFLYTLTNKPFIYAPYKLPPSPLKLPIIGNLHQIYGKSRHEALWELSKKYGPIMQIHIGSKPSLVISSPAMAKQILMIQDHIFCSRPMTSASKRLTYNYSDVAFSPHDNHQKEMRKIFVSELLGPKRAKLFNHLLVSETESMVSSLLLHPSNVAINLNKVLFATVKGVGCKLAFGNNYRQEPINGPSWEEMVHESLTMFAGGSVGDFFPWLGRFIDQLSGWNAKLENCFSNMDSYIETIIDDHHKQTVGELNDDNKDFVHTLIELCSNQNGSGYQLTKEDMKALIMDVITGAVGNTVVTLVWAIAEIIRNTRVMQKLQSEIREHMGRRPKVEEAPADITGKMSYLHMVIKETLRLHPAGPLLVPHECISRCQIGGYDVFPGTSALINVFGIARDPSIWGENAAEFYPERFENFEPGRFDMIPFGVGRRMCPASNMALVIVEFVIANLLCWFDWEVPNGEKNEDLNMQEEGTLVVRKKLPLCLHVVTKKNNEEDD